MKPPISRIAIALAISLSACSWQASAQVVPQTGTSAGPALTSYGGGTILAWAGISSQTDDGKVVHKLGYQLYDGAWLGQKFVAASTVASPALASGESQSLLAWTEANDLVYYATLNTETQTFTPASNPICLATICETTKAPALAGNTGSLIAAWTTSTGTIQYAGYSSTTGAWSLYPDAVPGVSTKLRPSLGIYNNELYLAWVNNSNQVEVEEAALPLPASGAVWTSLPAPGATTSVGPALSEGFYSVVPWKGGNELFLAWNTGSSIDFDYWDGSAWVSWLPTYPIPTGPLGNYTPALNYSVITGPSCNSVYAFNVAATLIGSDNGEVDFTPVNEVEYTSPFCKPLP